MPRGGDTTSSPSLQTEYDRASPAVEFQKPARQAAAQRRLEFRRRNKAGSGTSTRSVLTRTCIMGPTRAWPRPSAPHTIRCLQLAAVVVRGDVAGEGANEPSVRSAAVRRRTEVHPLA